MGKTEEKPRNYVVEGILVACGLLVAVTIFGALADKYCHSEEKAEEARRKGYDI